MAGAEIRETSLPEVMRPQHFAVHRVPQVEIIPGRISANLRGGIKAIPPSKTCTRTSTRPSVCARARLLSPATHRRRRDIYDKSDKSDGSLSREAPA